MNDNVNSPSHYLLRDDLEVKDVRAAILDKLQREGIVIPYNDIDNWSRSWEYLTRCFFKNGAEDVKKSKYYLDILVESIEERGNFIVDLEDKL
jgi:hypothetical protein